MSDTHTGVVKFFNDDKGYGFILPDNPNRTDVFVHVSAVNKSGIHGGLKKGDVVSYAIEKSRGKECAVDLKLCGREAQ